MRAFFSAAALAATVGPVAAQDFAVMQKATELGAVLAAEEMCGLSYDQGAIRAWINANIPVDAMDFPSTLSMMVEGSKYQNGSLSASSKTAHCAAIEQTARHYGFVK